MSYFLVVNFYSTGSTDFIVAIDSMVSHYKGSQGLPPHIAQLCKLVIISQCNDKYVLCKASGLFSCSKFNFFTLLDLLTA